MAPPNKPPRDDLSVYYQKRSADRTPEPFGGTSGPRPGAFVVQKHAARRLHYDLRLEINGTLKSWAVPQGPSIDPAIKRLAVRTEDHPLEYVDFEGVIPDGNYGAGPMIVWDRGSWSALEDPVAGLQNGKLLFELKGYKLRGVYTLVRTKSGAGNEWLLIKKPDAWAGPDGSRNFPQESILSGLTVEDLEAGPKKVIEIEAELSSLGAQRRPVDAAQVRPMLAEPAEAPFSKAGWLFELKYDGYRLIADKGGDQIHLYYRSGHDSTSAFPEVRRALLALPFPRLVLDGEVVVLDEQGVPSFQRLQKRVQLQRTLDVERATVDYPATYWLFDLLAFGEWDLRELPLRTRKGILSRLLPSAGIMRYSDHVEQHGEALWAEVERRKLEGLVAKRADAPYRSTRSKDWLKLRTERTGDFAVVGYTQPEGSRTGFSGLHLARVEEGEWRYVGKVGSGFDEATLVATRARLDQDLVSAPICSGIPKSRKNVWVDPKLVVEVRYFEITEEGFLRHPVFLRIRDDKPVAALLAEAEPAYETELLAPPPNVPGAPRKVPFTNLQKPFWPEEGYSKGDLIEFYRSISAHILPFLVDRPVVLTRYPDGIHGKNFFQKDAPPFIPGWLRTERMWSEHAQREIDYFVCDDEESLLYVINMGSIPLHVWSSRIATLQHPDWTILDLDPKGAPFSDVVQIALRIKALCDDLGLPTYPKTSGSSGLHVLIPLGRQCTYEQSRGLAELLAKVIVAELPQIATIVRPIGGREGRVYLDYLQNGHGRLLVSALCVRPLPAAPVSTPLDWSEVGPDLEPKRYTIRTVPERLAARPLIEWQKVLTDRPDLGAVLANLARRLA
ncbi:MAG: DNA ligase D [Deltaproteobacteria bacterium]|nr:DNA ligase D [Deltaproteobacteria bacterium]